VLPSLRRGGYQVTTQARIGPRPSGRQHIVDALAEKEGRRYLISLKWQQVSGTAEQKVPFELICLIHAMRSSEGEYQMAYLVLGGDGWTLRDFYTSGGLAEYTRHTEYVQIVTLEQFVALANKGNL